MNLSIIIPHYNSPLLLKKLLKSIPEKDDLEVIIIDDNSNEGLHDYALLKKEFTLVKYLSNNRLNKGAGACRNIGLEAATGKWVLFADADDYYISGFYDTISLYFKSDYDVVFFSPTSIDLNSGVISNRHKPYEERLQNYMKNGSQKDELELRYKFFVPWSKMIRRDVLLNNKIRFDETIVSNDMMFSAILGYHIERFCVSQEIIYCVTNSAATLTKKNDEKHFDIRVTIYISYYKYLKDKLDKNQFNLVNVSGRDYIIRAIKYRYSLMKILKTYLLFRSNKVRVFNVSDVNIFRLITVFKGIKFNN
jgi:glycosyltransferase involved in cell wall biosynthesis